MTKVLLEQACDEVYKAIENIPKKQFTIKSLVNLVFNDLDDEDRAKIMVLAALLVIIDKQQNRNDDVSYIL